MTSLTTDQLTTVQGGQAWFSRIGSSPYYVKTGKNPNPGPLGAPLDKMSWQKFSNDFTKAQLEVKRFLRMGGGESEIGSNYVARGESPDWYKNALGFTLHP